MAEPKLYDIQGVPIKAGSLVAFAFFDALLKERVAEVGLYRPGMPRVVLESGMMTRPDVCVVLEEPIWPNQ